MSRIEEEHADGRAALQRAFFDAAALAARVLSDDATARLWTTPSAVEGFSVGGLAAHLYAGIRRLEVGLDQALPQSAAIVAPSAFYGANRISDPGDRTQGFHAIILQDAERRAEHGQHAVQTRFSELIERLRNRLPDEPADRLIPVVQVPDGVTPLDAYLATRVAELVIHGDDLATSVGLPALSVPYDAASVVIGLFVDLARARAGDLEVVRGFARSERTTADALRVL
jgi:hypothetical protein